ncbi:5-dehydro-4-deoxyglucarate dehydratase [Virgibacillus necropolis]|uniref:Probable 5-dehydro-4-deoxyglucarate dehydratase n=1 Tax=Virgibacillus necropolis TaxID=163877 RepID=A0A221MF19_9BACI|nr:5-dehydro-4-deoxyglucarate dehydratase [Virgibacillus necropolis]ASN06266.1 5-dehydro-4-deoxyglucarate dehydratase [Virgibacillus necropolis]
MTITRKAPTGILGFPVAPFDQQENINMKALEQNIAFLIDGGVSSIFVACGAGEFQSLNKSEYRTMVEAAVSAVGGKVPVYTGVGGNISDAVELAQTSAQLGADGYLILPPYLIHGEQEGLFNYSKTIIESTNLNAIVYHRANALFTLDTVKQLVEFPQVVGFKDGHGDMDFNIELTQTIGDRLEWTNGMPLAEVTMPAYLPLGFKTYSSAISNYIPHVSRRFFHALLENDQKTVKELYRDVILPINTIRKQRKGYAVSLIKAGMDVVGLPVGNTVRPPIIPVEKEHYKQLEVIIENTLTKYPKQG